MSDDRNEALSQHDRDSRELRSLCAQRDAARETVRQQAERIAELEVTQAGIMQAITDPENQPSQYGTVTLDYLSDKLKEWERRWAKRDEQADKATAERDQLRAEVERLRADAERLNHIEKHARCDPKMDGQHVWWPTNFKHALRGATLRAAIDAAMQDGER